MTLETKHFRFTVLTFKVIVFLNACSSADAPYPPSNVITNLEWAPTESIIRKAQGSDTWPITWADDGALYTAFADGGGFEPKTRRLSLGYARVIGGPEDFSGKNIRSESGEQTGDGATGKKGSGMLMVDGTLYMWVRNADNNGNKCQLAWSDDHAVTWNWSHWKFDEFGYCIFLNYGRDYADARDNYVYVYSHDNPSAYHAADHMILMRVRKNRITDRDAYQFFTGLDAADHPTWSNDITARAPVFKHANNCLRSGISYNAGMDRYLWWQQLPQSGSKNFDTRFSGGFGVYDAPEPWGPWTTIFFTQNWDVGPGETANFPTKWISKDGKTIYLVFSGDDYFSIRKAKLSTRTNEATL